jgi:hypothetical protein
MRTSPTEYNVKGYNPFHFMLTAESLAKICSIYAAARFSVPTGLQYTYLVFSSLRCNASFARNTSKVDLGQFNAVKTFSRQPLSFFVIHESVARVQKGGTTSPGPCLVTSTELGLVVVPF